MWSKHKCLTQIMVKHFIYIYNTKITPTEEAQALVWIKWTHMRITIFNRIFFFFTGVLVVDCSCKNSVNTLPVTDWETHKGKTSRRQRAGKILSATFKETIPSAVFHVYLKYQNKITMMKPIISIKLPH